MDPEAEFLRIRATYEMLNDPVKRGVFALFGADAVTQCSTLFSAIDSTKSKQARDQLSCRTLSDYFWHAMLQTLGFYGGFGAMMAVMNWLTGML